MRKFARNRLNFCTYDLLDQGAETRCHLVILASLVNKSQSPRHRMPTFVHSAQSLVREGGGTEP